MYHEDDEDEYHSDEYHNDSNDIIDAMKLIIYS